MKTKFEKNNNYLLFGILGGLFFTVADWLVFYGDATPVSKKYDLISKGTAGIAPWRFNLSMVLSFLSVILLGISLFYIEVYIPKEKHKTIFHYLNVLNLTSWCTLHLFLCVVFYIYYYLMKEGYQEVAITICEAVGSQFMWVAVVCYLFICPLFLYYFWLVVTGRTYQNRFMALFNVMIISITISCIVKVLPLQYNSPVYMGLKGSKGNLGLLFHFIILYIYSCINSKP